MPAFTPTLPPSHSPPPPPSLWFVVRGLVLCSAYGVWGSKWGYRVHRADGLEGISAHQEASRVHISVSPETTHRNASIAHADLRADLRARLASTFAAPGRQSFFPLRGLPRHVSLRGLLGFATPHFRSGLRACHTPSPCLQHPIGPHLHLCHTTSPCRVVGMPDHVSFRGAFYGSWFATPRLRFCHTPAPFTA